MSCLHACSYVFAVCCFPLQSLSKFLEATKDLKTLLEVDPNNSVAQQELTEVKQLWTKKLREIQQQKENAAKAAPSSQKSKSGKSGGSSKKKSGQRKTPKDPIRTNPIAEFQRSTHELERLLQEFKEPKKQQPNPPSQARKNELDKLVKESKHKTKAPVSKAAETKAPDATRAAAPSQPPTATPTEAQVQVKENRSDIITKETSESGDHLTASKTTYYTGSSKFEAEVASKTTPSKSGTPTEGARPPTSSVAGKEKPAIENERKKIIIEEGPESEAEEESTPAAPGTQPSTSPQEQTAASQDVKPAAAVLTTKAKERLVS